MVVKYVRCFIAMNHVVKDNLEVKYFLIYFVSCTEIIYEVTNFMTV